MTSRVVLLCIIVSLASTGCRADTRDKSDSARASLSPVYPTNPLANTNWNSDAGPVMIVAAGIGGDSALVVMPEATDSTISTFQGVNAPIAGLAFDLFGRGGKVRSSVTAVALTSRDTTRECYAWPEARLSLSPPVTWQVGFATGHVHAIKLDSIEGIPSTDSAALAALIVRTVATLPAASDPTFRGLPFRVRSAYTFRLGSTDVVIADVVRSVNEEANPRLEHFLVVGEKQTGAGGNYDVGYFNRTAGPEESTQATEVLAVVQIGVTRRTAIVVSIQYDDGGKLGLIERDGVGEWRATWSSAYTDC
ncbi:MAG: hypothetical protein ACJ78R_11525 [Gemmatimonadaceae bacterium]